MFDPYRKWLGIHPKDQPPHYYGLLAIELFENDLDVIEGAADKQMSFVRQYQAGEHAAEAAKILNELATARLCLLKPSTKADYDAKLKTSLNPSSSEPDFQDLALAEAPQPKLPTKKHAGKKSKAAKSISPLVLGTGGALLGCLLMLAIFFFRSGHALPVKPMTSPDLADAKTDLPKPSRGDLNSSAIEPAVSNASPPGTSTATELASKSVASAAETSGNAEEMPGDASKPEPMTSPGPETAVVATTTESKSPDSPPSIDAGAGNSWLLDRKANARALILINESTVEEREAAMETCRQAKMPFDVLSDFPDLKFDYSKYSLIVVGTNVMFHWGAPEMKPDAAFEPIAAFVKAGGHLLVFNAFNGGCMEHLQQFGGSD